MDAVLELIASTAKYKAEIQSALGLTERQFYFAQRSTKAARTQHEEHAL